MIEKNNLPNLIIAGVNKAGTTSLFQYLSWHPDIFSSKVKETCFYLPARYEEEMQDLDIYKDFFKGYDGKEKYLMESTPGYFYGEKRIIDRMSEDLPDDIKIILLIREPVSRALSFYKFMIAMLKIKKSLSAKEYFSQCQSFTKQDFIQRDKNKYFALEGGNYIDYLPLWVEHFGVNLKILFTEDLNTNPLRVLQEVSEWLEIDSKYYKDKKFERENITRQYGNAYFHKIAIYLNKKGEIIFRKFPEIKKIIRKMYYGLNADDSKNNDASNDESNDESNEVREALTDYFCQNNNKLKEYLISKNITTLPEWLK